MGNSCAAAGCSGSKRGSNVVPLPAKGRSNQVSDAALLPAKGRSNQVSDAVQTIFKWRIDGFSSLVERVGGPTYSNVFPMRGLNWYLKLNPRDKKSGDQNDYVSLQLAQSIESVRSDTVVETTFKLLIYDQLYGKHHEQQVSHNFQKTSTCSETSCLIPLSELNKKSSGFLVDNSCVFCVDLISVVFIPKANDVSETLFVQKMNNTCSEPQVYTWNIDDLFVLKNPSSSPEFELCGHEWSIKIYPSGDHTNGNYLSLYLRMKVPDTLDENSAYLVERSISLKTKKSGKPMKATGCTEYSKNYSSWGWAKFIWLEDFKDPSNGYLVKTKCCIEVQVAVIGTSKMK